jgi:GT2 family glycosyltransferase
MVKYSILIPIHNRLPLTKLGLASLYKALDQYNSGGNRTCQFEVVVIDDGSTDGSSLWIAENYKDIHVLTGSGDLWWSGAINKGAAFAIDQLKADYLILWNDDIEPQGNYFLEVERIYSENLLTNTVLGSKIYVKGTGKIWSIGGRFSKRWGKYGLYDDPGSGVNEFFGCDWLPGMGTFVPTSILSLRRLQWDERRFPQYHGDSDFTLRCKEEGCEIKTCLRLVIYNNIASSGVGKTQDFNAFWSSLTSIRSNNNIKKRLIFYRQHGVAPFCYWGLARIYFSLFGSFFKRNILKF